MPIEFHCEHCRQVIRAPDEAAGKKGRCPKCQQTVYIPLPAAESGEIPLAPLDPEDARRQQESERERRQIERALWRDKATPGEGGRPQRPAAGGAAPGPAADPRKLVAEYLAALANGQLETAERCAAALSQVKARAMEVIEALSTNEQMAGDFPKLPRPVLMGFLKQLRSQLG